MWFGRFRYQGIVDIKEVRKERITHNATILDKLPKPCFWLLNARSQALTSYQDYRPISANEVHIMSDLFMHFPTAGTLRAKYEGAPEKLQDKHFEVASLKIKINAKKKIHGERNCHVLFPLHTDAPTSQPQPW